LTTRFARKGRVRMRLHRAVLQVDAVPIVRRPSIGDVDRSRPHRLHLAPHEHHSSLEPVLEVVVEARPPVLDEDLLLILLFRLLRHDSARPDLPHPQPSREPRATMLDTRRPGTRLSPPEFVARWSSLVARRAHNP